MATAYHLKQMEYMVTLYQYIIVIIVDSPEHIREYSCMSSA